MNNRQYSDEEILAAREERNKRQSMKKNISQSIFEKYNLPTPSEHIRNPVAGALSGIKGGLENLMKGFYTATHFKKPEANNLFELMQKEEPKETPGQQLVEKTPIGQFDPYQAMGVTEQPISTLAGIEQAAGEYGPTALGIGIGGISAIKNFPLSRKNIIKDVIKTSENLAQKYSGEKGLYKTLFGDAKKIGAKPELNVDPDKIRFNELGTDIRIKNDYRAVDKLRNKKDLDFNDYQKAIKELGIISREMDAVKLRKGTLTDKQSAKKHAAEDAIQYIQKNMFKDEKGKLISDLLKRHKDIQYGYATEYMPYELKAIQKYKQGKLTDKELLTAISKSPFRAERGKFHNITEREVLMKSLLGSGLLTGAGYVGKKIIGK